MRRQETGADLRRVERVEVGASVSAEISVTQQARITELSHIGARLEVVTPLHLETLHDMTLKVGRSTLRTRARVVHCRLTDTSQGQPTYVAGIEFVNLSEDARTTLAAYLAGLGDTPA